MLTLRPYQTDLLNALRKSIASGRKRVCAVLGCGGGKSVVLAMIAKSATAAGNRVLFLVHRRELVQQIRATFEACGVDFNLCTVGMVQTVTRRETETPALILIDEAHHVLSASYMRILDRFSDAVVVGFTATPMRMNEGGLGAVFEELVESVSTSWLIEHNYLCPYRYYGVTLTDASKLHTRHGDYDKQEVEQLMNRSAIFGGAVENWIQRAKGKKTIVYCSSIETSKRTAEAFNAAGFRAAHLDGCTSGALRASTVDEFRKGYITILTNVDLFGEGFDVPDCECVVLLRPTKSLTLHIQQSMRSMRYKAGKTAIILDHVGNYTRHGLPDEVRTWTLETHKTKEKDKKPIRQCKTCYAVFPSSVRACPVCGALHETEERAEQKTVEGVTLEEVKKRPHSDYLTCRTWEDLETLRKANKYKFAWSLHKAKERGIPIPSKYFYMMRRLHIA